MNTSYVEEILENIASQRDGIKIWLREFEQLKDQKHLDEGSVERLYYHLGRYEALNDVLRVLKYDN